MQPERPRYLDYAPPTDRRGISLELVILIALTIAPICLMLLFEPDMPSGRIAMAIWLGFGSVLPWRYAFKGRHDVWATLLAVPTTLLALAWVIVPLVSIFTDSSPALHGR